MGNTETCTVPCLITSSNALIATSGWNRAHAMFTPSARIEVGHAAHHSQVGPRPPVDARTFTGLPIVRECVQESIRRGIVAEACGSEYGVSG